MSQGHAGLPRSLLPEHYQISIHSIDVVENSFEGDVTIEFSVAGLTDELLLNALKLKIHEITLSSSTKNIDVISFETNEEQELLTAKLGEKLSQGDYLTVRITYQGPILDNMSAFYRSDFVDETTREPSICLSTQFEAASARSAFPCIDEPNFKATFGVELTVKDKWLALSNMPVSSKETVEGTGETKYVFDKSVKMSTYLVAWACGEFEYIETFTEKTYSGKKIPVRCYTTRGLKERGQFGLNVAAKAVDYFSEIFDIDYPLPKLDLISIPTYSHGAMENYGLITFRETALLFDPNTSDAKYQQNVAYVVSHECAHQWFGNLVTMNWWDELWLNEGFATWVGYLAVSHLYPEWDIFTKFISVSLQNALSLDSLRGSHPVEVPVHSVADINQVFDAISYLKGASIINMLSYALGVDVFLKGVSIYLKKHKFGNATTADLWEGISESSGVDVNALMECWIKKIGFPYIQVSKSNGSKYVFEQKRFLANGDVKESEDQTTWWVPLNFSSGLSSNELLKSGDFAHSFNTKSVEVEVDSFVKINKDSFGFYRVCYEPELLQSIFDNIDKLSVRDKVGLIADVASTATASLSKTSSLLELISSLKTEESFVCWDQILKRLAAVKRAWFEQPVDVQNALNNFCKSLFEPAIEKLGYVNSPSDSFLTKALRTDLLTASGIAGVEGVVEYATKLFSHWAESGEIESSLRSFVFNTVLSSPKLTDEQYELVVKEINSPSSIDGREIALNAVGNITSPEYQKKVVQLLLTPAIPAMDAHFFGESFGGNNTARWLLWNFIKDNYSELFAKLSPNIVIWDRFLKLGLSSFASDSAKKDIEQFFADKSKEGFDRGLSQILDQITANYNWVQRDSDNVKEWLIEKQFL